MRTGPTPPHLAVTSPAGVAMVLLPGGEFTMGSDQGEPDEQPRRVVQVAPFVIDKFEVTQDQFAALEMPDPSNFKGARRPVEQVRWSDAALFCNQRSLADGLDPCYHELTFECDFEANGYRLPTEAEWEYAARAGIETDESTRSATAALERHACYAANSPQRTETVGRRRPNAFGLHDMLGNVEEWCYDRYAPGYDAADGRPNPRGPEIGSQRVLRGGSWKSTAVDCRVSARSSDNPGISDACFARNTTGFRCVRSPDADELSWLEEKRAR